MVTSTIKGKHIYWDINLLFSSTHRNLCYRLNKRFKDKNDSNKKAILQEIEQKRNEAEKKRAERIKASPLRDLSPLQFEEFTKIYLEERNYKQVSLTRTSGDFGTDVIAIAPDNARVCVQCKKYSKPVGISAIQEVHSAKAYYKCELRKNAASSIRSKP